MDALADDPSTDIGLQMRMQVDARSRQLEGRGNGGAAPAVPPSKYQAPSAPAKVRIVLCVACMAGR